jgi:hypothetical protein
MSFGHEHWMSTGPRSSALLTNLGRRGCAEERAEYAVDGIDTDTDSDPEGTLKAEKMPNQGHAADARKD